MPFEKTNPNTKNSQSITSTRKIFIGRNNELDFFIGDILKCEYPTHNIVSISGNGGVGKSTLISMFIDLTHGSDFQDYCLTALVDEKQTDPAGIMERFAEQLRQKGYPLIKFENELARYKEALRNLQSEEKAKQEDIARKATAELAGATVKGVPIVGGILEKGTGLAVEYVLDELDNRQRRKDVQLLDKPVSELTKVFVNDLNRLAASQVSVSLKKPRRGFARFFDALLQHLPWLRRTQVHNLRILLFFDTFEQLAEEAAPWLLDHFLQASINFNIVLIIAGREPITHCPPYDPKRWLPYFENNTIHSISLESFTREETHKYLIERGVTEEDRISTIWELSHGLPLYLGLLTSNIQGNFDPTADVVANFLRWIPDQGSLKRRLALNVALFSRPFNRDDLGVLEYFPQDKDQQEALYQWLVGLPFVRNNLEDGRHHYHELVQEMFSRHLYHNSPKEYYSIRKVIANHYLSLLENVQKEQGKEMYNSIEWLELTLAVAYQLFLLQDETSHIKAIEQILYAYEHTEKIGDVVRLLRELSQKQQTNQISTSAKQITEHLLEFLAFRLESRAFLTATSALLDKLTQQSSLPTKLLSRIYRHRGRAYRQHQEYQQAIIDFDYAIKLDPNYVLAYSSRGTAYRLITKYKQAIVDFDYALKLDPNYIWAYLGRGTTYRLRNDVNSYKRAIADFDRVLMIDAKNFWAYNLRGETYHRLGEYEKAIADFDQALSLDTQAFWTYGLRGISYASLKRYKQAIEDFAQVLKLSPQSIWARDLHIEALRLLKEAGQTQSFDDFASQVIPPPPIFSQGSGAVGGPSSPPPPRPSW